MTEEDSEEESYPIESLHKDDLRHVFRDRNRKLAEDIARQIYQLTEDDMYYIAGKMADAFLSCCFWEALRAIFEDCYLSSCSGDSADKGRPGDTELKGGGG